MNPEQRRKAELDSISKRYAVEGAPTGDDYDPHDYRTVPHGTNYFETLAHVLKGSLGTGILAMPQAYKNAGWINGFVFTVFIGALCTYGIHILINAQYTLCKRLKVPYLSYPLAMKASLLSGPLSFVRFATASYVTVDAFLIIYQTGTCCVYIIFVAKNLKEIVDDYVAKPIAIEIYILFLVIPFVLIMFIPNLKWLAPFSLLSNILTFITCGIVLYFVFTDLKPFKNLRPFGIVENYPLFVGTTLFAVAAMGVITSVEKNMSKPKQFCAPYGVLNVSMIIITGVYALFGFFGYWAYQDEILASITLNLPPKSIPAKLCQGLYIVAIYISYALNGYVPVDIIWNSYTKPHLGDSKHPLAWEYLFRATLVCVTFVLAATIPLLGAFISLFGAFCMSGLEIIFPAIMDMCVNWSNESGARKWIVSKDIAMVILGCIGMCAGTYSSIRDIVNGLAEIHRLGLRSW